MGHACSGGIKQELPQLTRLSQPGILDFVAVHKLCDAPAESGVVLEGLWRKVKADKAGIRPGLTESFHMCSLKVLGHCKESEQPLGEVLAPRFVASILGVVDDAKKKKKSSQASCTL